MRCVLPRLIWAARGVGTSLQPEKCSWTYFLRLRRPATALTRGEILTAKRWVARSPPMRAPSLRKSEEATLSAALMVSFLCRKCRAKTTAKWSA
jgi:hypothetical protein